MVRKPQIILRSFELLSHALLAGIASFLLLFLTPAAFTPIFLAPILLYPAIRALFDEYTFIHLRSTVIRRTLREFVYAALSLSPALFLLPVQQVLSAALYLSLLSIVLQATLPTVERIFYTRFPESRIHILFLGPAPIAEYFLSQVTHRNLGHLFHPIGYVDYKKSSTELPFVGKFVDLEAILADMRPQVIVNTGRQEQHATISHAATVRGIQYFSFPQNIQWDTFELNHSGPFGLPLIEHTSSHLTYWSYALKRLLDIFFAITGLVLFFIPWLLRSIFSKTQAQETVVCSDPRNGREIVLRYPGKTPPHPHWRDYPLLLPVLFNKLSLVGSRPTHAICEYHFDLKIGLFPLPPSSSSDPEIQTLHYIRSWSTWREMSLILQGFWRMFISLFRS